MKPKAARGSIISLEASGTLDPLGGVEVTFRENLFRPIIDRALLVLLLAGSLSASAQTLSAWAQGTNRASQSQAEPSVAELVKDLQSPDIEHREVAAAAAAEIKPLPLTVVPLLLSSLKGLESQPSNDPVSDAVREQWRYSGNLVIALGNAGPPAIPNLSQALDDPDEAVRRGAVDALMLIARESPAAWPVLVGALGNKHDDVVRRIEGTINSNGNDAMAVKIVPLLQRSLSDPNPKTRGAAAVTLSYILQANGGTYCSSVIDDLANIHSWTNWTGPPPSDVILGVAKALNNVDRHNLPQTLYNLCNVGPSASVAIPYVLPLLKDRDGLIRFHALMYLAAMGPAANVAIPEVIPLLNDEPQIRVRAIDVMGVCGPAAKVAIPELSVALQSTDKEVSEHAALALAKVDPSHEGLLPVIMRVFNNPNQFNDYDQKERAIMALGQLGRIAKPAVPTLEFLLSKYTADDQAANQRAAVAALVNIEGTKAVPTLAQAIGEIQDDSVRVAAVKALGNLGSSDANAVDALVDALNNDAEAVRQAASDVLSELGEPAAPALIAALRSPHLYQRSFAIQVLSRLRSPSADVEQALKRALRDKSEIVRAEAVAALKSNKVDASATISSQQLDQDADIDTTDSAESGLAAFVSGKSEQSGPIYSRLQLSAPIPPDKDHQYGSKLKYLVAIAPPHVAIEDAPFLVTVHSERDGPDRLALWKKVGDDKYQRLFLQYASSQDDFEEPFVFSAKTLSTAEGKDRYETALFVDLPLRRVWGDGEGIDDTVFVLDGGTLRPVEIQAADEYSKKVYIGESTWNSLDNTFADDDLKFDFLVWEKDQCHACAGGAEVSGAYKVIKQGHYDAKNKVWLPDWKMVVDTAVRRPRREQ